MTKIYRLKDTNEDKGIFVFVVGETEEFLRGIGIRKETGGYKIDELYHIDREAVKEGIWEKITKHDFSILKEYLEDIKQLVFEPFRSFEKEHLTVVTEVITETVIKDGIMTTAKIKREWKDEIG